MPVQGLPRWREAAGRVGALTEGGGQIVRPARGARPAAQSFGGFFLVARNFDLFGNPLPRNLGEPGRNEHVPTAENASKVRAFLIARWTVAEIAREIGVSAPTLRKHYFRDLEKAREIAVREVKGKVIFRLMEEAENGKVAAMDKLFKIASLAAVDRLPATKPEKTAKAAKLGKKERIARDARQPRGEWASRLGPLGETGPH